MASDENKGGERAYIENLVFLSKNFEHDMMTELKIWDLNIYM